MLVRQLTPLLLLLPFAIADVHKFKLKKMQNVDNKAMDATSLMYRGQRYAGQVLIKDDDGADSMVLMGPDEFDLTWGSEQYSTITGGHNVPLRSQYTMIL